MACLRSSAPLLISSSCSSCSSSSSKRSVIRSAINLPKLPAQIVFSKFPAKHLVAFEEFTRRNGFAASVPVEQSRREEKVDSASIQLHALLEAVADRIEMHENICQQRNNWNTLLLNSVNMITLTATAMGGVSAAAGSHNLAINISAALLFSAATAILAVMNKIQPSQLAEEQRQASRLFKQLESQIKTTLALRSPTLADVSDVIERVLSLDKAYPLPLFGAMLEKLPATFEPAVWWPTPKTATTPLPRESRKPLSGNGWTADLEKEMRDVMVAMRTRDSEEYKKLGNIVLKVNKILAISGPLLTGVAAAGSACAGLSPWAAVAAVVGGALGGTVASLEHGGQVGMIFEMYRNCAGFFNMLEESIESTLREGDVEKRENGAVFEMKIAVKLGRSLSQLRDFAKSAAACASPRDLHEFASKLF